MFSVQRQFHIEEIVDTKHRELPMKTIGIKQCLVVGNGSWVTRLGTECKVHTYANGSHLLFLCSEAGALGTSASDFLGRFWCTVL